MVSWLYLSSFRYVVLPSCRWLVVFVVFSLRCPVILSIAGCICLFVTSSCHLVVGSLYMSSFRYVDLPSCRLLVVFVFSFCRPAILSLSSCILSSFRFVVQPSCRWLVVFVVFLRKFCLFDFSSPLLSTCTYSEAKSR